MSTGTLLVGHARAIADFEVPVAGTVALAEAARNYEANRIALEAACPAAAMALPDHLPEMEWLYARDGALTARHVDRQWFGDCSVPRRAAERLLAKFEINGTSAVMLAPSHAQQVRATLARATDRQAIVAVIPGEYDAGIIFACENFAAAIRSGRLLVVVGPDWNRQLDELLADRDGVAPATTMVRVPGINEAIVERMIKPCDTILSRHAQLHKQHLTLIHGKPRNEKKIERVAVVTGGWRLWRDERTLLEGAACASAEPVMIDIARPDTSSALSIARRAENCDALVMANVARADLPLLVPPTVPWVTLLTAGRPAAPSDLNKRDRLVLVDESQRAGAVAAGWPAERIDVLDRVAAQPSTGGRPALAIDLRPVVKPAAIAEMSSHGLVWDRILARLADVAHVETKPPLAMIAAVAETVGVSPGDLPNDMLWELAAVPTFAVALARRLRQMHVPFDLYGSGWEAVPDVVDCWRGPIADAAAFESIRASASAFFNVWPGSASHASRRAGLPLIETWGRSDVEIAKDVRAVPKAAATVARLDLDAIIRRLGL